MKTILMLALISSSDVNIPKANLNDLQLTNIFNAILGLAGALAVVFVVLGGLRYTLSQGNAQDLEKGKNMIVYALVGLGVVILAFTIVQVATNRLF